MIVAVAVFVLALVWIVVGVAGLRGTLRRNRWLGVRSEATLSSETAFALANKVAAPGTLGAAGILVAGGVLTLGVDSSWSFLFGLGGLVVAFVLVGAVSGYAVRAARWAETEDSDHNCSCCSGGDSGAAAEGHEHADPVTGTPAADAAAAADCGESSCGSCTLRGACLGGDDTAVTRS